MYGKLGLGNLKYNQYPQSITYLNKHYCIKVVTGIEHSVVLTNKGKVFTFGNNNLGQLGINNNQNYVKIPTQILHSKKFDNIYANYNFTIISTEINEIFSFGDNKFGKLGINNKIIKHTSFPYQLLKPIKTFIKNIYMGKNNCFLLSDDGNVYLLGLNPYTKYEYHIPKKINYLDNYNVIDILIKDDNYVVFHLIDNKLQEILLYDNYNNQGKQIII